MRQNDRTAMAIILKHCSLFNLSLIIMLHTSRQSSLWRAYSLKMHPHTVCVYNTRITCTECKDAASCCRCSVVYRLLSVSVCWSQMRAQQMAKANDVWVVESGGPKEPYIGGPDALRGRDNFGYWSLSKVHCNSESTENGYINYTVYTLSQKTRHHTFVRNFAKC